jgi:hypothetical protein
MTVLSNIPEGYERVDPVTQLCSMLAWSEDYTDEYKREWVEKAIQHVTGSFIRKP